MPADLVINPHRFIPEKGVNLNLEDTLDWAVETKQEIMMWGPYEYPEFTYYRWLNRIADLESGKVKYQCIDPLVIRVVEKPARRLERVVIQLGRHVRGADRPERR